ncbi:hypothetical protein FKW77_002993 [Venturia effusa]|uniref:Major facilitator superfamily (MFS) profile domain-containing protein n=1 Tax=Venturia effusa TaxID=50376 RepID=A0A517LL28_9PEZI|nr:hypothetical protein FKW77_002993 [Venturia effusa]
MFESPKAHLEASNTDPEKAAGSKHGRWPTGRQRHFSNKKIPTKAEIENSPTLELLSFPHDDPAKPSNWSTTKKFLVLMSVINAVNNSNLGSTLSSNPESLTKRFGVANNILLVLPSAVFLLGYVFGPLAAAPMSEKYGRKGVLTACFLVYTVALLCCAIAPNFGALVFFRLCMGFGASTALSVVGGTCADLYSDDIRRGRAVSWFIAAAGFGQGIGAILSGYLAPKAWNLPYWAAFVIALVSLGILLITPETFEPIILKKRAQYLRKYHGAKVYAPIELQKAGLHDFVTKQMVRPAKMFGTEPLAFFTCLYLALVYGVYYLFFQAYHRVYEKGYKMDPGQASLTFIPVGIGGIFAFLISLLYDRYLRKTERNGKLNERNREEKLRLPIACLAGPLLTISMFWTGASASQPQNAPWPIPVSALIPFGMGYTLIFAALSNYLVDSYEKYAASAMAASSATRSLVAAALPMCSKALYDALGIAWGFYFLGFLMLALSFIPLVFLKWGPVIRKKSKFCQELRKEKEEQGLS